MKKILQLSFWRLFTSFQRVFPTAIFLLCAYGMLQAEGTKELSGGNANTNSALLIYQSRGTGPYLTMPEENRIKIRIADFNTEKIYYGFKWREYGNGTDVPNAIANGTIWARIYDPSGNEVHRFKFSGSTSTTSGYISDFSNAVNGPNIFTGETSGYAPNTFTPTMNGEYSMVFYRSGTGTNNGNGDNPSGTQQFWASFWDITVANSTTKFTGRVFCQKWGLVVINSSEINNVHASGAPIFYSYSDDQTVIKLGFGAPSGGSSGFSPIAYDIAFNHYGVTNTGNWTEDRKSKETGTTGPTLSNGFKAFLNPPDATLYPITDIPDNPNFAAIPITGCPGGDLTVHFNMPAAGDVRIVFDIDGGAGYTPGTRDFVLEGYDRPAGKDSITWNGKDGQGNNLISGTQIKIGATYRRGRFNLPIFDAEINTQGMYIETIAPLSSPSNRLYWNDASLTKAYVSGTCSDQNENVTGIGWDNSFNGTLSSSSDRTRAWNGNGNTDNVVPAPSVTRGSNQNDGSNNSAQCDDYGNVRTLNTWGWALEAESDVITFYFGCYSISGKVWNDGNGNAGQDGSEQPVSGNPANNNSGGSVLAGGKIFASVVDANNRVIATVQVNEDGTYEFNNLPGGAKYKVVLTTGNTGPVVGSTLADSSLPDGWGPTGTNIDGTANTTNKTNSLTIDLLGGNTVNMDFGIQRTPTADPKEYEPNESDFSNIPPAGYPSFNNYKSIPMSSTTLVDINDGSTGSLSGSDPEDCASAGSCNGNSGGSGTTFTIGAINANTRLFYDFGDGNGPVEIFNNTTIPNFDASKMVIYGKQGHGTGADDDEFGFTYTITDKAGAVSPAVDYKIRLNNPLPVQLLNFDATKRDNKVLIAWATASEQNNRGFDIERSLDGRSWTSLAFVQSKANNGNSNIRKEYVHIDTNPAKGKNYYRLRVTDINGKYEYSNIRVVVFGAVNDVTVSPNPTRDNIIISGLKAGQSVRLYDVTGKLILQRVAINTNADIDMSAYSNGLYFVNVVAADGINRTFKVEKIK